MVNKRAKLIEQGKGFDKDSTINYSQFLSKVIDVRMHINEEDLRKVFQQINNDESGVLSKSKLDNFFKRKGYDKNDECADKAYAEIKNQTTSSVYLEKDDFKNRKTLGSALNEENKEITYTSFIKFVTKDEKTKVEKPALLVQNIPKVIFMSAQIFLNSIHYLIDLQRIEEKEDVETAASSKKRQKSRNTSPLNYKKEMISVPEDTVQRKTLFNLKTVVLDDHFGQE